MADETGTTEGKQNRGFALLSPERRSEIAAMGGRVAAPEDRSFSRDRALAAAAGSKGGTISKRPKRTVPA